MLFVAGCSIGATTMPSELSPDAALGTANPTRIETTEPSQTEVPPPDVGESGSSAAPSGSPGASTSGESSPTPTTRPTPRATPKATPKVTPPPTAVPLTAAHFLSPPNGSTLPGADVTFQWNAVTPAIWYSVYVRSAPQANSCASGATCQAQTCLGEAPDVAFSGSDTQTSHEFTSLPTDGSSLFVRLFTQTSPNGPCLWRDYSFTASTS